LFYERIGNRGDCGYNELRRTMYSRYRLNSGFVPGRSQANGAMSLAIVAACLINVGAKDCAR